MRSDQQRVAEGYSAEAAAMKAHIAKRCEGRKGRVPQSKKRHVEEMTRLPTKRMATACWAFIVAKSTPRKAAPILDFRSLQGPNSQKSSTGYQQACTRLLKRAPMSTPDGPRRQWTAVRDEFHQRIDPIKIAESEARTH
jgi:hypothetical protein